MIVLTDLKVREKATVIAINTENNNALRVMTLGIIEQTKIKIISKTSSSVEILLYGKKVAISNDIAKDIMVVRY